MEELTLDERNRLTVLENRLEHLIESYRTMRLEWGQVLGEILNSRLYRQSHPNFETYLKDRWGMSRSRGYQLIEAAGIQRNVHNCRQSESNAPVREAQTRELAKVPKEKQPKVWEKARKGREPGKVTAAEVKAAREVVVKRRKETPIKPKPSKEQALVIYRIRWALTQLAEIDELAEARKQIRGWLQETESRFQEVKAHPLWQDVIKAFCDGYEAEYGVEPDLHKQDMMQLKGLMERQAIRDMQWWERAIQKFVQDKEEWVAGHGNPMRVFSTHFNRWHPDKRDTTSKMARVLRDGLEAGEEMRKEGLL